MSHDNGGKRDENIEPEFSSWQFREFNEALSNGRFKKRLGSFGGSVAEGAGLVDWAASSSIRATTRRCSVNGGNAISNARKKFFLNRFRVSGVLPEQSASTVAMTVGSRNQ